MRELKLVAEFPGYGVTNDGKVYSYKSNRWLNPYVMKTGYMGVRLSKNKKPKNILVHRLVAELYIPKVSGKNCVNHKDLNKKNNNVKNLEWCTHSENTKHAYDNGALQSTSAPLTDREALVFSMLEAGARVKDIAYKIGMSRQLITHVKMGRTWNKAAKEYGYTHE
mgnify:CR=1 FL=1